MISVMMKFCFFCVCIKKNKFPHINIACQGVGEGRWVQKSAPNLTHFYSCQMKVLEKVRRVILT